MLGSGFLMACVSLGGLFLQWPIGYFSGKVDRLQTSPEIYGWLPYHRQVRAGLPGAGLPGAGPPAAPIPLRQT